MIEKYLEKKESEDLEDYAYRHIIHMIVENQLKPGDSVLETELAKVLNVSRTPIRQALGRLITEGLLEKQRKKSCKVPLPEPEDARMIFQAREILESRVAGLAALNRSDEDLDRLRKILEDETQALASQDKDGYYLCNENFHFTLAKAGGNAYLERYCRHLFRRSSYYIFYFDSFYSHGKRRKKLPRQQTPDQHAKIVEALALRDADAAARLVAEHVQYSFEVLLGI